MSRTANKRDSLYPFLAALGIAALLGVLRIIYASPYAASWDAVDFALALDRFDLLAMQPHFPGYPYFVFLGMLLRLLAGNPVISLSIVSAIAWSTAAVPMYRLVRATLPAWPTALMVSAMQGAAYAWVIASQPMSESLAAALVWWYLWSLRSAFCSDRCIVKLAPAFTFGLLMGVRLSYLPFGIGLLLLFLSEWRHKRKRHVFVLVVGIVIFQLIWALALAASEGSLAGFIQLSVEFARGHFTDWGGAVTAETGEPLSMRLLRLIVYNILWVGLLGGNLWSSIVLAFTIAISIAAAMRGHRNTGISERSRSNGAAAARIDIGLRLAMLLSAFYFLWALFAQNIDKPRHIFPLIALLLWFVGYAVSSVTFRNSHRRSNLIRTAVICSAVFFIAIQYATGIALLLEQRREQPPTYQLKHYLDRLEGSFIVYTWEETRVLQYLQADFAHRRVYTYELFLQEINAQPWEEIYVTSAVVEGFMQQGHDVRAHVIPVARFRGNPMIEPVYYDVHLYLWKN